MTASRAWRSVRPLLAGVSRSFGIVLRALPWPVQRSAGLGYLLARASDTIADTAALSVESRLAHLANYAVMLRTGPQPAFCRGIDAEIGRNTPHEAERQLMFRIHDVLAALHAMPEWDREAIQTVLRSILKAQRTDIERFGQKRPGELVALQDERALHEYTDLVAGSVGEFWTAICRHHWRGFSHLSDAELVPWGRAYGRALQLVNILRDMPEDFQNGRCYLPVDIERLAQDPPAELMRSRSEWFRQAHDGLVDGWLYSRSLRSIRLRFATGLPALVGFETLRLVQSASWEKLNIGVKITRAQLRQCTLLMLAGAMSTRLMDMAFRPYVSPQKPA